MRQILQRPDFAGKASLPLIDSEMRARIYRIYQPLNRALAEDYGIVQDTPDGLFEPHQAREDLLSEPNETILARALAALQELQIAHDRLKGMVHAQNRESLRLRAEIEALKGK